VKDLLQFASEYGLGNVLSIAIFIIFGFVIRWVFRMAEKLMDANAHREERLAHIITVDIGGVRSSVERLNEESKRRHDETRDAFHRVCKLTHNQEGGR
jgi:hypothetical protein